MRAEFAEEEVEHLEPYEREDRGGDGHTIHTCARGHTYARYCPEACCGCEAADDLSVEYDGSGADETYAANDLCRDAAGVESEAVVCGEELLEAPLRYDHEESASERYEEVRAESRLLDAPFAFDTYDGAEQSGHDEAQDEDPSH